MIIAQFPLSAFPRSDVGYRKLEEIKKRAHLRLMAEISLRWKLCLEKQRLLAAQRYGLIMESKLLICLYSQGHTVHNNNKGRGHPMIIWEVVTTLCSWVQFLGEVVLPEDPRWVLAL